MSLLTILRSGVKVIDKIVKPLEGDVTFQKCVLMNDAYKTPTFPYAAIVLKAIVEWKEVQVPSGSGLIDATRPTILFLDYAALMTATLGEGIKEEDNLILQDGTTGPVQVINGFLDAGTGKTIYTEVILG